jgi:hypothetical protein
MRSVSNLLLLLAAVALGSFLAACGTDTPTEDPDGFTFRFTQLTEPPVSFQHGIFSIVTLNMIETEGSDPVRVDAPPEFPLTATLEYQTVDGQKRKVSSSYGYRC